jgi:hypothetical protein
VLRHPKELIDDLDLAWVLQVPFGISNDFLQVISSDTIATELAKNVKKKFDAV